MVRRSIFLDSGLDGVREEGTGGQILAEPTAVPMQRAEARDVEELYHVRALGSTIELQKGTDYVHANT